MIDYVNRNIEEKLIDLLQYFPVIGITGPRQSGKSTLLRNVMKDKYRFVTFDDFLNVELFRKDPEKFIANYNRDVVFDEIQKVPELFHYIKRVVDEDRKIPGRFVITGSAQFTMMASITESLAGRIGLLSLLPFQYNEIERAGFVPSEFLGSYPELVLNNHANKDVWYNSYIETYLEKDVRSILDIGNLNGFRQFIRLLASHCSQVLNYSTLANSIGVASNTVRRWVSVLEASYIIFLLPPYYNNLNKRIIKSSKLYFYDTGLVSFLTGIRDETMYENGPMAGAIFENYVVAEVKKKMLHAADYRQMYFYRTSNHTEVDLFVEKGFNLDMIEIKHSQTFRSKMLHQIESIIREGDMGYLLYKGRKFQYSDQILVWPFQDYLLNN